MSGVRINESRCMRCGYCNLFMDCPQKAISRNAENISESTHFFINSRLCKGCFKCLKMRYCNAFEIFDDEGEIIQLKENFTFKDPNIHKALIVPESSVEYEDGLISSYGKYVKTEAQLGFDFQHLRMKHGTEDAHVHDDETEIIFMWGTEFEAWVRQDGVMSKFASSGERVCMVVPPCCPHGVKVTGDKELEVIIMYKPGLTNWP